MAIGNVNIWMKLRDPRSHSTNVKGSFTANDADDLAPSDIELSTIQSINLAPLNVETGSALTVAGSFGSGEANDLPGDRVNISAVLLGEAGPTAATEGSHRIAFDAVGW